jgi:hypothetical protein
MSAAAAGTASARMAAVLNNNFLMADPLVIGSTLMKQRGINLVA